MSTPYAAIFDTKLIETHIEKRLFRSQHFVADDVFNQEKVVAQMSKFMAQRKMKPAKGNINEKVSKATANRFQLKMPKISPSSRNPRWNKTARNS